MNRTLRNLALFGSMVIVLSFVVFVVNQTAQVVQLASTFDPAAGRVVLIGLVGAYAVLLAVPIVMVVRLPRALVPPARREGPEFAAHLGLLRKRLRVNPHHKLADLEGEGAVERAIERLDEEAVRIARMTASQVFVSTAVSQSGRLDTFLVLSLQTRMVWKIARLYNQRPSLREMVNLYANVAGTAFAAGEIQDVDLSEQIEPVFSAVVGSIGGAVPGFQLVASILANSVMSGAADAFLTLRVGMITKRYCGALVVEQPATLRRKATSEAAEHIGAIVAEGTARVTRALWSHSKGKVGGAAKDAYSKVLTVFERMKQRSQAEAPI